MLTRSSVMHLRTDVVQEERENEIAEKKPIHVRPPVGERYLLNFCTFSNTAHEMSNRVEEVESGYSTAQQMGGISG